MKKWEWSWRKPFTFDHAMVVKTFTVPLMCSGFNEVGYIHCSESARGKRSVSVVINTTVNSVHTRCVAATTLSEFYQTRIVRWLSGRRDTEIPTYSEISQCDLANALKGENS